MLRKQKGSTLHAIRHSNLKSRLGREGRGRLFLENSSDPHSFFPSFFPSSPFFLIFHSFSSSFRYFYFLVTTVRHRFQPYFSHGSPSSPRAHATNVTAESILSRFGESIKAVGICSSSTSGLFRCSASLETLASHLRGEITTTTLMLTSRTCLPPNRKLLICISIDDTVKLLLMCSP